MPNLSVRNESSKTQPFRVRFLHYGSLTRPAYWSTVIVVAKSAKDAMRAARNRYRRAAKFEIEK